MFAPGWLWFGFGLALMLFGSGWLCFGLALVWLWVGFGFAWVALGRLWFCVGLATKQHTGSTRSEPNPNNVNMFELFWVGLVLGLLRVGFGLGWVGCGLVWVGFGFALGWLRNSM